MIKKKKNFSLKLFFLIGLTIVLIVFTLLLTIKSSTKTILDFKKKSLINIKEDISAETMIKWRDENGCLINDGFTWCAERNKCLREWEEPCNKTASSSASAQETGSATRVAFALIRLIELPSDLLMPKEMEVIHNGKTQEYKGLGFNYPAPYYINNVETKAILIKEYMNRNGFVMQSQSGNNNFSDLGKIVYKKMDVICSLNFHKLENTEKFEDKKDDDDNRDNTWLIKNVDNPEGLTFEFSCADIKDEYLKKE